MISVSLVVNGSTMWFFGEVVVEDGALKSFPPGV